MRRPKIGQRYSALMAGLGLLVAGCSVRIPSDWLTYESHLMHLTVVHPAEWEIKESTQTFAFVYRDPGSGHTAMVGFGYIDDPFTRDLLSSAKVFPKQVVHGRTHEIVLLHGKKGIRSEGSAFDASDAWTRGYSFMQGDLVLNVFLLAHSHTLFERIVPDFELMLKTLRVKDGGPSK